MSRRGISLKEVSILPKFKFGIIEILLLSVIHPSIFKGRSLLNHEYHDPNPAMI